LNVGISDARLTASQATGMQNLHLPPETCQANCKQYKLTSLYA